jgi:hypothetical protein
MKVKLSCTEEETAGGWRKLRSEKLPSLYPPQGDMTATKSHGIWSPGNVARMVGI